MRTGLKTDIFINTVLPIVAGGFIYLSAKSIQVNGFVRNQLPDGLWAYAFCSCILIIWQRKINITWALVILGSFIIFEWLQYLHVVRGTGDIWDVATYIIFSAAAFFTNKYFINHQRKNN